MIFIYAWLVMLLVGMAHHTDPHIPAVGYATTVFLSTAGYLIVFFGAHSAKGAK